MLEEFPVIVEVPVSWGDMDAFQHVNNTIYFRFFECARIAYFESIGFDKMISDSGVGPILGSTNCRFRLPLTYPDTVQIGAKVDQVNTDNFTMKYIVVSKKHEKIAAEGEGYLVSYDYVKGEKTALPDKIKQRISELESRHI